MRQELGQLLVEGLAVDRLQRWAAFAPRPDGGGPVPVAHRALEVAGVRERELHLAGEVRSALRRLQVVEVACENDVGVALARLPLAEVAPGRVVVALECRPHRFRRAALPDGAQALRGHVAEVEAPVLAARPHLAELVEVHGGVGRVAGGPPTGDLRPGGVLDRLDGHGDRDRRPRTFRRSTGVCRCSGTPESDHRPSLVCDSSRCHGPTHGGRVEPRDHSPPPSRRFQFRIGADVGPPLLSQRSSLGSLIPKTEQGKLQLCGPRMARLIGESSSQCPPPQNSPGSII